MSSPLLSEKGVPEKRHGGSSLSLQGGDVGVACQLVLHSLDDVGRLVDDRPEA